MQQSHGNKEWYSNRRYNRKKFGMGERFCICHVISQEFGKISFNNRLFLYNIRASRYTRIVVAWFSENFPPCLGTTSTEFSAANGNASRLKRNIDRQRRRVTSPLTISSIALTCHCIGDERFARLARKRVKRWSKQPRSIAEVNIYIAAVLRLTLRMFSFVCFVEISTNSSSPILRTIFGLRVWFLARNSLSRIFMYRSSTL